VTLPVYGYDSSPEADTIIFVLATPQDQYLMSNGELTRHLEKARRFFLRESARLVGRASAYKVTVRTHKWSDFP